VLHAIRPFPGRPLRGSLVNLVAALGLAYLVGVAVVIAVVIALLVGGVALSLPAFTLMALAIAGTGIAIGVLRETEPPPPAAGLERTFPARIDRLFLVACAVLFAGFALLVLPMFTSAPTVEWDSWSIWARKAIALFQFNTLEPAFWTAKPYAFMHQDYPILLPLLEELHFKAIGRIDTQSLHVQLWFLFLAFPWAIGYLVARAGRATVWAPIVLGAAAAPAIAGVVIGGLADVPVMLFVGAGILALGMWVDTRDRFFLAVATVLLVGAASTKNEGILAAVVALFMAGVVVFRDRPRRALRELGLAAGVFLVMIAPWQVWAAHAGVPKDVNAGDGLNPLYLAKHLDRAWPAFKTLQAQLVDQSKWSWFVPLAIVVIATAILVRTATRTAVFYALTGLGIYAALVWAYWASLYPIDLYLAQSAFRVVDGLGAVAMVALAHVGARLGSTAFAADVPAGPPDGEVAALERGEPEAAPDKRSLAPAGLLAFWRA
jgi:hypothetical protein